MANQGLFASAVAKLFPATDAVNRQGSMAYAYGPEHKLAQIAVTGAFGDTFYASAETQLSDVVAALDHVDPLFAAKAAIYARKSGKMKDMPALITAWLTVADPDLAVTVFDRVIDNGRMLRNFVQIIRSGQVGRTSLGSRPKKLVQRWLEQASVKQLMDAATGNDPSLADIIKMVHPKPVTAERKAFYAWAIGRPYDVAGLPEPIQAFEAWKRNKRLALPDVPFLWLTAQELKAKDWAKIAPRMGWQAVRMNLNTLGRNGAFGQPNVADVVAKRLADKEAIAKARVLPYQLMTALTNVGDTVPLKVQAALEDALDFSLANVPVVEGRVVVCPDVSGSMSSAVTGYRKGATSAVRCIDVAALVAAAMLRANREARVLPFECNIVPLVLDADARVAVNAAKLAKIGGGGTNVSAPLAKLNAEGAVVDLVVIVSDNESWIDNNRHGATQTMREWERLKNRNPNARLVCIDIQPYGTTQAKGRADILNVGGFSDAVFDVIARFAKGETRDWVSIIDAVEL